ncbi:MAG TPA: F0F1 ATP synthase subunit B [Candidatus Saccharimonadales bacterium]
MTQHIGQFGAESSSGIGALGINPQALVIQLITFVLAYLVLRKYAFKPILKVLGERRELIENGVKLGEEMQKERTELDRKVSATLQDARRQADTVVAEAHDASRDLQREAEEKARLKAENIVTEAHARAEQDKQQMRKQLEQEVVGLISDATEVIIDEKVDARKDAALIDRALKRRSQGRRA